MYMGLDGYHEFKWRIEGMATSWRSQKTATGVVWWTWSMGGETENWLSSYELWVLLCSLLLGHIQMKSILEIWLSKCTQFLHSCTNLDFTLKWHLRVGNITQYQARFHFKSIFLIDPDDSRNVWTSISCSTLRWHLHSCSSNFRRILCQILMIYFQRKID